MLAADWSKGSIKMVGVNASGCVFRSCRTRSREATREGQAMEDEKQGESECPEKKMARKEKRREK